MTDTSVKICDIVFSGPVMPAAGTVPFGYCDAEKYGLEKFGSMVIPGVTMKPDPRERQSVNYARYDGVLISEYNPNPGVYRVQEEELPRLRDAYKKKVFASVCGKTVEEFVKVAEIMDRNESVCILELDSACRNQENSGIRFGKNATSLYKIVHEVKYRVRKPVFAKLVPDVTNIRDMAKAAQDGGADGVVISGAYPGMSLDLATRKPILRCDCRFTGAALKPLVISNVFEVFDAVGITAVSCGGVTCAEDALEMICAGASLVQLDDAAMRDPLACAEIADRLPSVMKKYGIERIKDVIGSAH